MKRALLTGATGFVGANLARRLLRDGHEVHLLVRAMHARWRIADIRDDVHLHEADLLDSEAVAREVGLARPDWIFHLAAHGAYSHQTEMQRIVRTNVLGTMNLVEASLAVGFEAFVNTGSSSEYGFKNHPPPETDILEPNSAYAVGKASATQFCQFIGRSRGVHIPTLRLYSIYGPFEDPSRLLPTLLICALNGRLPPLVDPEIARDFVYVDDAIDAFLLAATTPREDPGAIYNVGSGVQTTLRDLVTVVRRELGVAAEPEWGSMPDRQWDTKVWVADRDKITEALGWQPRHSLQEGVRGMAEWFRDRPRLRQRYESQCLK